MKLKSTQLKYLLHATVIIGLIVVAVKYLNGQEIFQALKNFDYSYGPIILLLTTCYLLLRAWRFVRLLHPLQSDPPASTVFKAYLAGQPATLAPGGIAARAGLLKQIDVPLGQATTAVIFNSGLDQGVLISGALVAAFWFEQGRGPVLILLGIIGLIGLLLTVSGTRNWIFSIIHRLANKTDLHDQWHGFLEAVPKMTARRTVARTTVLTIAAFACHVTALHLTLTGLDLSLPLSTVVLVYSLPTAVGRFSGLSGGIGVTEAGMVGFLTSVSGDIHTGIATAIVAIFRIAAIVVPALIGAVVYFIYWDGEKEVSPSTT